MFFLHIFVFSLICFGVTSLTPSFLSDLDGWPGFAVSLGQGVLVGGFTLLWFGRKEFFAQLRGPSGEEGPSLPFEGAFAKVLRVIDGDSVDLQVLITPRDDPDNIDGGDEFLIECRLAYIDAPEFTQENGEAAKSYLESLVSCSEILRVSAFERDQYGRYLVVLYSPDGVCLNEEMVAAGHAMVFPHNDKSAIKPYMRLQSEAKRARRGLWRSGFVQSPWDYRKTASRHE